MPCVPAETPTLSPSSRFGSQQTGADPARSVGPGPVVLSVPALRGMISLSHPAPLWESVLRPSSVQPFWLPQYCSLLTLSPRHQLSPGTTASVWGQIRPIGQRLPGDLESLGPGGGAETEHLQFRGLPPGCTPAPLLGVERTSSPAWLPALPGRSFQAG